MDWFDLESFSELLTLYIPRIAGALITLVVGFIVIGWLTGLLRRTMERQKFDPTLRPFLVSLTNVGLKIMLLLTVAGMFGVQTTSFIAVLGALVFAIGLGLQGTLGHFASGVLLLVFRPYRVNDLVTIAGGKTGRVKAVQVFNTVLQTLDNQRIIVPNGLVTSNIITNIDGEETMGVDLTFGIEYGGDIDRAREVILRVASECPYVLDVPPVGVVVSELADSSVNLSTRPFCKTADYLNTKFYMLEHVKKAFDAEGIGFPFPTITLDSVPGARQ